MKKVSCKRFGHKWVEIKDDVIWVVQGKSYDKKSYYCDRCPMIKANKNI